MDTTEFIGWLSRVERLSGDQLVQAFAELEEFARRSGEVGRRRSGEAPPEPDGSATIGAGNVERLGCVHCGADKIVGWGRSHGLPRYRCKGCERTFNVATGTAMARLRKKDRWLDLAQAMAEGVSLAKAAERCGVHPTTAYRWRRRFQSAPVEKQQTLREVSEAAHEKFILESFQRLRSSLARNARKRGGEARHPSDESDPEA